MPNALRSVISFLVAWGILCAVGTFIGAQFILYNLHTLGGDVSFSTWLAVSLNDMFAMLPIVSYFNERFLWSAFMGPGLLLALVGAWAAVKWAPPVFARNKTLVYSVAGFVGVVVLLSTIAGVISLTPLAAARSALGLFLQGVAGGVAGYIYFLVRQQLEPALATHQL